ncbi:MAG: hypothetical protein GKC05_06085 [Methanomicrobiales archaeon]|nr:hypothetical protein [Methanomicrobiales archaeon]NYT20672.1 hypothetical protein [Methanomicrobiales archaeon]
MELRTILSILSRQFVVVLLFVFIFCFSVPLLIGLALKISSGLILSLIFSTFLLQATASPAGVALGIPPAVILAVMTSFAVGMTLAIQEICITFSQTSEGVKQWLDKVEAKMRKYTIIHRYGAVSCTFISWIPGLGLYSTPVIAFLLRWKRIPSAFFTVFGFFLVSLGFLLLTLGIIVL